MVASKSAARENTDLSFEAVAVAVLWLSVIAPCGMRVSGIKTYRMGDRQEPYAGEIRFRTHRRPSKNLHPAFVRSLGPFDHVEFSGSLAIAILC